MKNFTARLFQDGPRIITVQTKDKAEAVNEVYEQLNRLGRFSFLDRWIDGGKIVDEVED